MRDMIFSVFYKCKDIEFLKLVNLLDNYIPLVFSIYSIVFKCNKYELFYKSLIHCWVMFVVFRRRHYCKALLVHFLHPSTGKKISHPCSTPYINTCWLLTNIQWRIFIRCYDEEQKKQTLQITLHSRPKKLMPANMI